MFFYKEHLIAEDINFVSLMIFISKEKIFFSRNILPVEIFNYFSASS